jgi:hypothetical protein
VTAHQIERWQKAGLLPSRRRRARGRGKGSVSAYPPGTVGQVRALLRFLEQHRNLDKVAALLKLNGYTVSTRACRRAVERLVLDPFEELDPYGERRFRDCSAVATEAAESVLSKRLRTDEERAARAKDEQRVGGKDGLVRITAASLLPAFGGFNAQALLTAVDSIDAGNIARALDAAAPELGAAVAEEGAAGHLGIDWIRNEALPLLTHESFDTAVRMGRALLATVEILGLEVSSSDAFNSDCLSALRRPERRLPAPPLTSTTGEQEAEDAALAFFAKQRRHKKPSPDARKTHTTTQ